MFDASQIRLYLETRKSFNIVLIFFNEYKYQNKNNKCFPSPNTTKEQDTRDKCFSTMSAVSHIFPSKDKLYIEMRTLYDDEINVQASTIEL